MKAIHSEEFYRSQLQEMFQRYGSKCDFEGDLEKMMPDFSFLPDGQRKAAEKVARNEMAKRIVKCAETELMEMMRQVKEIREGRAALGYTSKRQEVEEWYKLQEGFEFRCLMLADFRKRYGC